METIDKITQLEIDGYFNSTDAMCEAFAHLIERWDEGGRDRETMLRLLFLIWYNCADQCFEPSPRSHPSFQEVFEALGVGDSEDAELLYAAGVMADVAPWCCGDEKTWKKRSKHYLNKCKRILDGIPRPTTFSGRGAYGAYFEHMANNNVGAA